MLPEQLVGELEIVKDLDRFFSLTATHVFVEHGKDEGDILHLDRAPIGLSLLAHGALQLSDLPVSLALGGVLTKPFRESRVQTLALDEQARSDGATNSKLWKQAPIHICPYRSVDGVAERDELRSLGHGLDISHRIPLLHAV